jgi:hypothetical protein
MPGGVTVLACLPGVAVLAAVLTVEVVVEGVHLISGAMCIANC